MLVRRLIILSTDTRKGQPIKKLLVALGVAGMAGTAYPQGDMVERTIQSAYYGNQDRDLNRSIRSLIDIIDVLNRATDNNLSEILNINLSTIENNRKNSIGVHLGEPSGINVRIGSGDIINLEAIIHNSESLLKSWLTSKTAWLPRSRAWGISISYPILPEGYLHCHLDHLWYTYEAFPSEAGIIPVYYGIGGRVRFADDHHLGLRVIVGVNYFFMEQPFDLFFEIAPILDLSPDIGPDFNAVVGLRYDFR